MAPEPPRVRKEAGPTDGRGARRRAADILLSGFLVLVVLLLASRFPVSDIAVYQGYAKGFLLHGGFPREYPPLSLVPMLLAHALAAVARIGFAQAWLLLGAVALFALTLTIGRPSVLLALLPLASPLLGTYDVWPILCLVASYLLLERRPALSWLLLGAAIALKLFPLLFVPLWWQRERRGWAYALLPLLSLYPPAMSSVLHWQFARQAEWESTVSLFSYVLTPGAVTMRHAFGAVELYSAASGALALALDGLYVLLFAWITFLRRDLGLAARMLLLLSLWFLTNKALSVQYVFWVVCLAYAAGLELLPFAALGWCTALLYPWLSAEAAALRGLGVLHAGLGPALGLAMTLVALRLAVWLIILARLLRRRGRAWETPPAAPG